jgi:hypothetical protein
MTRMTRRTSPCAGCSIHDLYGNHPGPQIARGELCPNCGWACCRVCAGPAERCVIVDGEDVYWCHADSPPACESCGETAVPRDGLLCRHCWEAEQPVVVRGARLLLPVLAHMMAWRRRHYEPPNLRCEYDLCPACGASDCECAFHAPREDGLYDRDTVPAPDAEASEPVGMSIATAYTLIRRTGGLALIVGLA